MTKQTIFSTIIIIVAAAAVIGLTIWSKKHNPAVPNTNTPVVVDGESKYLITKEPQWISVAEDSFLLGVSGNYPQFSQADASFNKKIADLVTGSTVEFKKNVNAEYEARLKTGGEEFEKQFAESDLYTLSWTAKVVQSNDNYISVIMRQEGYSGGAHGYHVASSFNYDVKNQKELKITDFVTLEQASKVSRESLKKMYDENGGSEIYESFALPGTDPKMPENFEVFSFIPNEITLIFNEYQVGPYAYGEQQAVVPF